VHGLWLPAPALGVGLALAVIIDATVASISLTPIVFLRFGSGSSICEAPVSSMTSIALSGSLRSWM